MEEQINKRIKEAYSQHESHQEVKMERKLINIKETEMKAAGLMKSRNSVRVVGAQDLVGMDLVRK